MDQIIKVPLLFFSGNSGFLPVLSVCLVLCGCTEATLTPSMPQDSHIPATIHLTVSGDIQTNITTRALDDSSISDLHILVYGSDNCLTGHQYTTGNNVTMQAASGSGCTIYAIANTGNPTLFDGAAASTIDKLKAMVTGEITSVEGIKTNDRLLMSGSLSNVTITSGNGVQTIAGLKVQRLAAKITLNVTTVAGITITGYSIKNLPSKSYITARPNANETSANDAAAGDDAVNARFNMPLVSTSSISGLSFYMYENRQGGRVSVNGTTGDLTNQQQKALYAPANATYVEVYAKGRDYKATYKIYLGADNCSNYNVKRNSTYTCDVNITGVADVDTRAAKVAFSSNCYMVAPGSRVVFPVSRANEDGTTRIADVTTGWTAELLWTDNANGVKADGTSNIKSVTAQLSDGTIMVEAGSKEGNAVVVAKVNGTVVWSWHIWVTGYNPQTTNISYNNGYSTTVFMDRNLGAKNSIVDNVGSYGLLYQWGRKDPFPASASLTTTTSASIYNASGTKLTENGTTGTGVKLENVAATNNLSNAIQNPLTFYYNTKSPFDWYSSETTQDNNLWNNTDNTKTVYDPCPEGWRVPVSGTGSSSPWYFSSSAYKSGIFTYGWNWADNSYKLGWYPAAGYRRHFTGKIVSPGIYGDYWSASVSGTYARSLYFGKKTFNSSYTGTYSYRSNGCSVRCVKITGN